MRNFSLSRVLTLMTMGTRRGGGRERERKKTDKFIFFLQLLNNSVEKSIYRKLANVEELMNKYYQHTEGYSNCFFSLLILLLYV